MILDKSMLATKYILMKLLHNQMTTIKDPLHMIFLYNTDASMHDLGIHNIFTNSITKKLFFQLIQV